MIEQYAVIQTGPSARSWPNTFAKREYAEAEAEKIARDLHQTTYVAKIVAAYRPTVQKQEYQ